MANLDKETVKYLAELSRIAVSENEEESLLHDLKKILKYVEMLEEVDTSKVQPCTYVTQSLTQSPLRQDIPENTLTREQFMKDAPLHVGGMIRVPPVIKQDQ